MKQILHIFRKDTRRFWIEILLSIAVLATYALCYHVGWQQQRVFFGARAYMFLLQGFDKLVVFLIPVAWLLLITRVVQAEAPSGDRQWWVTRPYEWEQLLAAKVIFFLVWLYLPLLLALMTILHRAGLAPLGHISHWLFLLSFISAFLVFPLVGIAAVTSNFARMMLTLLGAAVVIIIFFSWMSAHGPTYWPTVVYPHHQYVFATMIFGGIAAIVTQYATRRAWLARALMIGAAVMAAVISITNIAMRQREVDREFPEGSVASAPPLQAKFRSYDPNNPPNYSDRVLVYPSQPERMTVQLPLQFSGVAEGSAVKIENAKFTMEAANGQHWSSPWFATQSLQYAAGTYNPSFGITMAREQYDRFKSQTMTLHLTFAVTELHQAHQVTVPFSVGDFDVDGLGMCSSERNLDGIHTLVCRSEVQPELTRITTTFSNYPCSAPQPAPQDVITGYAWTGRPYTDQLDSVLDPIVLNLVQPELHHPNGQLGGTHNRTFCPGTPMHFTQYAVTRRTQVSLTIPNFQLPTEPIF